jgi:hypothetical protein
MRRYVITCEFYRAKRAALFGERLHGLVSDWEQPLSGLWLVTTGLHASDLRSALLPHLDFQDRLYICEAGSDAAAFNAQPSATRPKVTDLDYARQRSRMLTGIFSRGGGASRHLRAATAKSLKSA